MTNYKYKIISESDNDLIPSEILVMNDDELKGAIRTLAIIGDKWPTIIDLETGISVDGERPKEKI